MNVSKLDTSVGLLPFLKLLSLNKVKKRQNQPVLIRCLCDQSVIDTQYFIYDTPKEKNILGIISIFHSKSDPWNMKGYPFYL